MSADIEIHLMSVAVSRCENFAFSCHEGYTKMPKPFSDYLRWRIICQRLFYAKRYNDVASQLFVSGRTVLRTI